MKGHEFLGSLALFASVPPRILKKWAAHFFPKRYDKDQSLYWQNDSASNLHLIQSGTIKVVKRDREGREFIVDFFGPGELLGCCCLIGNNRFPCSAFAVEPTVVWQVASDPLFQLMTDFPQVAIALMQQVTRQLYRSHDGLQSLAIDTAEKRIVLTLLDIGRRFGTAENGFLLLPTRLTRLENLADRVGCTPETVSRIITKFCGMGWLQRRRRQLVLIHPAALSHEMGTSFFS